MDGRQDESIYEDCLEELLTYDRRSIGMEIGRFKMNEEEAIVTEDGYYHRLEEESYQEF